MMQMLLGWDADTWRKARRWAKAMGLKRSNSIIPQGPLKISETEVCSRAIACMSFKDAAFVREQWELRGGPTKGPSDLVA